MELDTNFKFSQSIPRLSITSLIRIFKGSNALTEREITSSVLFGDFMVQNGIFLTIGEQYYIVYYPIIYDLKIKVYRVETIDMG